MTRVEAWERRSEVPLLLLAVAFLVAYAVPILEPGADPTVLGFLRALSWAVWAAFVVDLVARVVLVEQGRRGAYVRRHWYDVVLVAVPMLRPLRILRVIAFARILDRAMARNLAGRVTLYVGGAAAAAVGLGSLAVLDAERAADGANITTYGDAVWWACTTVTTVGYGDRYPVTGEGRVVAVALMLVGIAFVGSVTAAIAAWFVEHLREGEETRA